MEPFEFLRPEPWNAETLCTNRCWQTEFTDELRGNLTEELIVTGELSASTKQKLDEFFYPLLLTLEFGSGVVLIKNVDLIGDANHRELILMNVLGSQFGVPVPQNVNGSKIVEVTDEGADIDNPQVRGHKSSQALPFHSDRCDITVLYCVHPARRGGITKIVSGVSALNYVEANYDGAAEDLRIPFPFDQRGEESLGHPPWVELPIFSKPNLPFVIRYNNRFIRDSQRHRSAPRLTSRQKVIIELVERFLGEEAYHLSFEMQPGDMLIVNNHTTLHSRTAFVDGGLRRKLLRIWISSRFSRPLPKGFESVFGSTLSTAVRGGICN